MPSPNDRLYSETHEWHKAEGDGSTLLLGLTRFAVNSLTDITYVQMKPVGTRFKAGDSIGEVESVKTTSDVYCAVDGEIIEVNKALSDDPGLLNRDPYDKGWLARIKVFNSAGLKALSSAEAYDAAHPD